MPLVAAAVRYRCTYTPGMTVAKLVHLASSLDNSSCERPLDVAVVARPLPKNTRAVGPACLALSPVDQGAHAATTDGPSAPRQGVAIAVLPNSFRSAGDNR